MSYDLSADVWRKMKDDEVDQTAGRGRAEEDAKYHSASAHIPLNRSNLQRHVIVV